MRYELYTPSPEATLIVIRHRPDDVYNEPSLLMIEPDGSSSWHPISADYYIYTRKEQKILCETESLEELFLAINSSRAYKKNKAAYIQALVGLEV